MNLPRAAPYRRYRLLVAHLLEKKLWTPEQLLAPRLPQTDAEALLRTETISTER